MIKSNNISSSSKRLKSCEKNVALSSTESYGRYCSICIVKINDQFSSLRAV